MPILQVPTQNNAQYTLDSQLAAGGTTLTLNQTVTGIVQAPGVCVIDRIDSSGNFTPSAREYIKFTGVSGAQLTGLTRGLAGSTDQVHAVGAIVDFNADVVWAQSVYDTMTAEHSTTGAHVSLPSLANLRVSSQMIASGASLSGINPTVPVFAFVGNLSSASYLGVPLDMPRPGTWNWASVVLRSPVSSASVVVDILKNGTSIFAATTRPSILGGGTYASTASILTKTFVAGDILAAQVINGNGLDAAVKIHGR